MRDPVYLAFGYLLSILLGVGLLLAPPVTRAQTESAEEATEEATEEAGEDDGLSLTPTRNLAFETREATWMSLDVSPDGEQIVFELLGDLSTTTRRFLIVAILVMAASRRVWKIRRRRTERAITVAAGVENSGR